MTKDIRYQQDFLSELNREDLSHTRESIARMLAHSHVQEQAETAKRPHIAMPERRTGSRYSMPMAGRCWDALRISPLDDEKRSVRIVDISRSGCSFVCEPSFHPSQIVSLEFRPPYADKEQQILVEVVRAHKESKSQPSFRIGCRAIDEEYVLHARETAKHLRSIRALLDDHSSIRVLCLIDKAEDTAIANWLEKQEYRVETANSDEAMLVKIQSDIPHLVVYPAAGADGPTAAWISYVRRTHPSVGIVAACQNAQQRGQAILHGADQSLLLSQMDTNMRLCLSRAYYYRVLASTETPRLSSEKVLVATRDDKSLRKIETILLGHKYLVAQAHTHDEILDELDMQKFDVLVAASEFFRYDGYGEIEALRRRLPALIIVIITDNTEDAALALGKDADLALSSGATRKEILECLEQASKLVAVKTFCRN